MHNLRIQYSFPPPKHHPKDHHDAQMEIFLIEFFELIFKMFDLLKKILTSKIKAKAVIMTIESQEMHMALLTYVKAFMITQPFSWQITLYTGQKKYSLNCLRMCMHNEVPNIYSLGCLRTSKNIWYWSNVYLNKTYILRVCWLELLFRAKPPSACV